MSNLNTTISGTALVDPAIVAAAIERGRRERSIAVWTMLQAMFQRPKEPSAKEFAAAGEPNIYGAR